MKAELILDALTALAGEPHDGELVYTRALERREIELVLRQGGDESGWRVVGVGGEAAEGWMTADRAVELRESKGPATLLLVHSASAGAGMDGIYSAAREIEERPLLEKAIQLAQRRLSPELRSFAGEALREATGLGGRRRTLSPRERFVLFVALLEDPERPGLAIRRVSLWPIEGPVEEARSRLASAAKMVEHLLLPPSTSKTPESRIASLLLENPDEAAVKELGDLLRGTAGRPITEILAEVAERPSLRLGALVPGFLGDQVKGIEIESWRDRGGKLAKWSGLKEPDPDAAPQFVVDPENKKNKLEVRWKVFPETLPKGAATYRVRVLAGDEELASKDTVHSGSSVQKATFTAADFADLEEEGRWEAHVEVSVAGNESVEPATTEDFVLLFGEVPPEEKQSAGQLYRCPVEGLLDAADLDAVEAVVQKRAKGETGLPDKNGALSFRLPERGKGFRVERPKLLAQVEEDWLNRQDVAVARWVVQVRPDGSLLGSPECVDLLPDPGGETWAVRLIEGVKAFKKDLAGTGGVLSRTYLHNRAGSQVAVDYLNAWREAFENGPAKVALAATLEIQNAAGETVGLVVLPFHPLRLAWQAAYDTLALQLRFTEKRPVSNVRAELGSFDGAHYPFLLPGLEEGDMFVFGDCFGLAGVAMVSIKDREPKASVALMAAAYTGDSEKAAPTISGASGAALAREIRAYLDSHADCHQLRIHAIKPGDGATVVRALGRALAADSSSEGGEEETELRPVSVRLDLYPTDSHPLMAGRFLTKLTQRRRSGAAAPAPEEAWCLESVDFGGGRLQPRLRWAKRSSPAPEETGHLAIAFDAFRSRVEFLPRGEEAQPILAFGLVANVQKSFVPSSDEPVWRTRIPASWDGQKLDDRIVTDRLLQLHSAILRAIARDHGSEESWPVLATYLNAEDKDLLERLHERSDWVVTLDRNIGIEYFDSPQDFPRVFDAYVIDAVPERDDLGCLQMITSTAHFDEVRNLLGGTLEKMGLPGTARNCHFLMNRLKALSGHLALELASGLGRADGGMGAELVALALAYSQSQSVESVNYPWPILRRGFFVPLEDVRDLLELDEIKRKSESAPAPPVNLLYVGLGSRDSLVFRFVAVKYRRHLKVARGIEVREEIAQQLEECRRRWEERYFAESESAARVLRLARLGRVLRFYADKAARHHLAPEQSESGREIYEKLVAAIDRLLLRPFEPRIDENASRDLGLVFCPEYEDREPQTLEHEDLSIVLFGPHALPDGASPIGRNGRDVAAIFPEDQGASWRREKEETSPQPALTDSEDRTGSTAGEDAEPGAAEINVSDGGENPDVEPDEGVSIFLGRSRSGQDVAWSPSIKGNPHLMIVGLPGMGKTTALANICRQLYASGIAPIVFSYHEDLDEKLAGFLSSLTTHDCYELGFNPMEVRLRTKYAHVDAAGELRDIFAAIFPELGDLQLSLLRNAILESYRKLGWDNEDSEPSAPLFSSFLSEIRRLATDRRDSRTEGLLARLAELEDYGFFENVNPSEASLLEGQDARIVRIHTVRSEMAQRAYASFVLYRIYQDMFRRGVQKKLTHAVVFDEAHRASRLKLLPTMAKECRKFGLSLIVASQEAADFDDGLFSAIANYLVLRVTDADAKAMARNVSPADQEKAVIDQLKKLPKFEALFFSGERRKPTAVALANPSETETMRVDPGPAG